MDPRDWHGTRPAMRLDGSRLISCSVAPKAPADASCCSTNQSREAVPVEKIAAEYRCIREFSGDWLPDDDVGN